MNKIRKINYFNIINQGVISMNMNFFSTPYSYLVKFTEPMWNNNLVHSNRPASQIKKLINLSHEWFNLINPMKILVKKLIKLVKK